MSYVLLYIRKIKIGCKESKASENTANVIKTVEVIEDKVGILGVQHTPKKIPLPSIKIREKLQLGSAAASWLPPYTGEDSA